eukprot:symbB.v1.2.002924.t1/scaffold147.1/size298323/5
MNHQYTDQGKEKKLGDDWQKDRTASGAKNETAPQVAPFYWGIKDVQFEKRSGWTRAMLKRVSKSYQVPKFMHPSCNDDFASTPEFWFGSGSAGAKAHMDSHVQATLSVQISGTKRWRLMPLRRRTAPFLAMIYGDGQPYENPEGWSPIFDITLQPGEGLFFPPGMIHETKNVGDVCAASVTFQFNQPYATRFYRTFFPRIRFTADLGESWALIREWARLGMPGDEKGKGESYDKARQKVELQKHFSKLDKDQNGFLSLEELSGMHSASSGLAWHDSNRDKLISLEEFREGFAFWAAVTQEAVKSTPKEWRKFQLIGTVENLEDIPAHISQKMRKASFLSEAGSGLHRICLLDFFQAPKHVDYLDYPKAWEDEHDHDKAAVEQLTNTWKEEVKNWMDDSLGATYSDRTYTKKIQEHIAALMGMPFEHGRSRHCVMIKLEQTLIPDFVPLRTSCREKVFKEMENKMLFVTVLYEDEDFTVDMAYNRTSPLGRIVKLTPEKLDKLMYEGTRPDESSPKASPKAAAEEPGDGDESPEPPAMMKTKSHFSIRPDMGKLKRFVALLAEEGEEPPIFQDRDSLDQFAFICEHEACEFKVPIPATVSKFKLMVWFQNNVDGQPTEELIGFSEPFDLILPDEAALMGEDQADQKRIPFYTSWHTTLTQGLKIIQADDPVEEAKTWFGRLKNQVREYLAPPITKTHVKNSTGFVDMSVRNLTAEELKIDKDYVDAMKDVTVGNSEINKSKLKRHLDRRGILSNFFGLRMEDTCIDGGEETLKAHLKRLEDFYKANQSGWTVELAEKTDMGGRQTKLENLLLAQDIRRSLWKNDDMEKAIESIKQSIEDYEKTKKKEVDANIKIYPRYRITQRYRGPRRVDQESVDFDTAILSELKKFKQDQARTGKSILHYVMVADHLKHNKFWSPDAISPHVCGIIVNNTPDVPSVRLQCHKFNQPAAGEDPKAKISKDMVFHRETLGSSKELPAFVNGRLCFKATDEEAEKYYKAFVPESPETWKVAKKGAPEVQEWTPVYLYWDGFARWVVSPFRGEPAPYGLATDTNQNLFLYCRDQATTPDRISKTQFKKWENGMWKEDTSIRVLNRDGSMATKQEANRAEQLRVHAKSVNEDSGSSSWIGEMFKGLMFIFVSTTSKKSSPEIKECLIGLEGGNITIAWKDIHQESLAPLRTFLLDEFTTYQAAWVFLCRNCTIKKTVCVRNLARMLRRSLEGLQAMLKVQERIETQEKRKRMKAAGQMQKTFTNATAAQSSAPGGNEEEEEAQEEEEAKPKEEEKEPEAPAKSTLFSGFGRMMGKAAKSAKAAATGMAGAAKNAASAAAHAAMGCLDRRTNVDLRM